MAKIRKSTEPARSCWHCRFYIRPDLSFTLDAAMSSICFINRQPSLYAGLSQPYSGDRTAHPDDTCGKFEFDPPPTQVSLALRKGRRS